MTTAQELNYPVVLWRTGYILVASSSLELCSHPRSLFEETVLRAHRGEWQLADASGSRYQVTDWQKIDPPGGIKGWALRMLNSVFAAPTLASGTRLDLHDFRACLESAVESRYRFDGGKTPAAQIGEAIRSATSFETAIRTLPKVWDDQDPS